VLAPEGVITVATPNALYPDPQLFDDPTHCHIYTLAELRELFERAGFHVEQAYSLMPFLVSRRTTWRLARIAFGPMLELRRLPSFRERGLTLVLEARKDPPHHGDPPHEERKHDPTC
jgi:hypothetical protein